ncbi:MAG TPA: AMP-binding protein [Gemmatimonadaceae bacterium]|nr:AMP-binding protein [Gemmatimonadaceae bacterium]
MSHAAVACWLARDARATLGALDLSSDALNVLAARRMRALLVDAQRSPFHAARMREAGLARPDALRDADFPLALQSLSPVTKHDLREAGDAALRDGRASASWFSSQSSGSSGEPFRVYYDARAWSTLKYLVKMRSRRATGVTLADRIAILDAIPISAEGDAPLERAGRLRRISVFRSPEAIATLLADYRPATIYALPSALLEVARAMSSGAPRVRAKRIFTSGELLTRAARQTLIEAFGGALFDVYGTSETKEIAWECTTGSRHINADVVYVEILDERGAVVPAGTEGEIVVTVLVNGAMPLVRYRTGDRGALLASRCSCGRASPLLGVVSGREADTLELPDGSTRSPYLLTMALERIPALAQFQIVQRERDLLHVSAVASIGGRADVSVLERAIRDSLHEVLPRDIRIDVSVVERLVRGPREKVRVVSPMPRSSDVIPELVVAPGAE